MTEKRIALTTAGSKEEAQKIAHTLVERHLAACVNIVGPIESVYYWHGKVETSTEYQVVIKTMADALEAVQRAVMELHSYELPEFVVLTVDAGSRQYLEWIEGCVR
jgi:periplasmic divalent cation tolerance protein